MRERTSALSGELYAGPRPGGGFRVRATLPIGGGKPDPADTTREGERAP
jgi:hypothetical protein